MIDSLLYFSALRRDIDKNEDKVRYAKEAREEEMRVVYEGMLKKLDSQLKAKQNTLKGQKNSIFKEC